MKTDRGTLILVALVASSILFVGYIIVEELSHGFERRERAGVRKAIDEALGGRQGHFRLWTEFERDEFVRQMDRLADAKSFELDLEYGSCPDDFLAKIRGLRGVNSVHVVKTGVTDAGLVHVATLTELKNLLLYHEQVTDDGLRALRDCPQLESLSLSLHGGQGISLPDLLATTKVKSLSLDDTFGECWIKDGIDEVDGAPHLKELQLHCLDLTADKVQLLRAKLPGCTVRAFSRAAGRDKQEIAPLGEPLIR